MKRENQNQNRVVVRVAQLDDFTLSDLLLSDRLPSWIIEHAQQLIGKRQIQFLACRFLLAELLHQFCHIEQLPQIISNNNNRPIFSNSELPDFNISHSGHFIAVAMCRHGRVGLDIEQHRVRANLDKVANNFFSANECQWLSSLDDKLAGFWRLWTLRESALKLYAKGVWQMRELQVDPITFNVSSTFATDFHMTYLQQNGVHLSLSCNQEIDNLQIITAPSIGAPSHR